MKFLRTPFLQNTSGRQFLYLGKQICHHTLEDLSICLRVSNKLYRINRRVNYFVIRQSFAWWGWHFNNIILAMQNFIFMKIMILTFQSFNRREEKIKWTCIKIFLIILHLTFRSFHRKKKKYNSKCFSILLWFV